MVGQEKWCCSFTKSRTSVCIKNKVVKLGVIIDPSEYSFQDTHKLITGAIVPRPIALVSTISKDGEYNVVPFSYFNDICSKPSTTMFTPARRGWDGTEKDILINIRDTEEFVVNIVSDSFAEKMVLYATDFEPDVDEIYDEGRVNLEKLQAVGRLAGNWYTRLTDNYKIIRKIKPDL